MTSASTFSDSQEITQNNQPESGDPSAGTYDEVTGPVVDTNEGMYSAFLHGKQPGIDQVQIAMSQSALRQIEGHSVSDLSRELGGVLLGQKIEEGQSILVKVLAALPVVTDDHGPVHFTFTADSWAQLHKDKAFRYPELDIVGWFHTHPNLGVFYSADDVIVHSAAFVLPWHVGLVIDPVLGEGFFVGWQNGSDAEANPELGVIDGYYELLDEQKSSAASWQFVQSTVWQQGGYSHSYDEVSNQVYAPASDWLNLPAISPWWGVLLGGLSFLISMLLLLDRLLASVN
jgi:proteasome lid subunit RPN8/RPN11